VNQFAPRISALLLFGLSAIPIRAGNPDLSLAPPPILSQAAWGELQANHTGAKVATLKAAITARNGTITDVTVKEAALWPQTAAEVQAWIKQHWKFVPAFSGTVVQPVSFQIVQTTSKQSSSLFLSSAPAPKLSDSAWKELQGKSSKQQSLTLRAKITAIRGAISEVTVEDADQWPQTSAEVQAWIKQHWKFVPAYSGTSVQPMFFKIPSPAWKSSGAGIFQSSPKPNFPMQYHAAVRAYEEKNNFRRAPGVYLSITVQNGAITDIRVLDQTGPTELCTYTVNWVRRTWVPQPTIQGTFSLPVYYMY
jgi:hypothetical protein